MNFNENASDFLESGGHSHLEVTGMCGQDPQSIGVFRWQTIK